MGGDYERNMDAVDDVRFKDEAKRKETIEHKLVLMNGEQID